MVFDVLSRPKCGVCVGRVVGDGTPRLHEPPRSDDHVLGEGVKNAVHFVVSLGGA